MSEGTRVYLLIGRSPVALASVCLFAAVDEAKQKSKWGKHTLLVRKHTPRAAVAGLWETACTRISQASQVSVITVYRRDWPVLAKKPYYQLMGKG